MLVTCPSCQSSYRLAEGTLYAGRKLRCARCRTSWLAEPPSAEAHQPASLEASAPGSASADTSGDALITITDEDGRLIRRVRRYRGEEYVLIDNRPRGARTGVFVNLDLAPPRITIPREEYVVDADEASYEVIERTFMAPPVERLERSYSLDEIRQNAPLRERVRSVDLDTITFDTGSWEVRDDQIKKLENVGLAMEEAVKKNPRTVFMVEGHTDAVGSDDDNLSLSDRRAESVAEILTKYFDIPAENLTTQGYGEQFLKVKTEAAEERNRRVTVRNITPLLSSSAN
ncbi:OmpA family protein [Hansschlegelia beijingensis]|uniref:OmpA family protein n=1 Tax=Hansschlegelia beijingensis TaxID=1133344 RepID=UPI00387F309C